MIKSHHFARLWLPLMLCCLSLTLRAANITITGYSPIGEYNDEPLYELGETHIKVKLTDYNYLTTVKVDDTTIIDNFYEAFYSCTIDLTSFIDSNVHKLEVRYGNYVHSGVCYFRFDDEVTEMDSDDFNKIIYEIQGDSVAVVSSASQDIKVAVIASEYNYNRKVYPVTSINSGAFSYCNDLVSIKIPESITSIHCDAFENCENLKSVYFDAINCRTDSASYNPYHNLSDVLPHSIERIRFGSKVSTIPEYLCSGCSKLTNLTIPNSVTTIGQCAFSECSSLTSLEIGNSVAIIGDRSFSECSGLTNIEIPNSVKTIGEHAFSGCSGLTSIIIPESVTSIGWCSFYRCNGLTSVYIPKTVMTIGHLPFHNCKNLTEITVDPQNPNYSSYDGILFNKDGSVMIDWPEGKKPYYIPSFAKILDWGVFNSFKDLTTIDIPNSVTEIGAGAFAYSAIDSLRIPNSVTTIREWAFQMMSDRISYLYVPASIKSFGKSVFSGTGINNVEFENIESIAGINYEDDLSNPLCNANHLIIDGKEITDLVIPNTVTSISNYAFRSHYELWTSITISESVTSIGERAFSSCNNCKYVTCYASIPPALGSNVFDSIAKIPVLYVPKGSVEEYKNSDWAQYFASIEEIKNYLTVEIEGAGKVYANVFNEVESGKKFDGTDFSFFLLPESGNQIASITLNDEDITANLIGHRLSISNHVGTGELRITFAPENKATLTVYGADTHSITHTYKEGSTATVKLHPEAGWTLHSATYNGQDVTNLLHDNDFETEPLYGSNNLSFVLTNDNTDSIDGANAPDSKVRISVKRNTVSIQGLDNDEPVSVYDLAGTTVYTGFDRRITLPSGKVYILTTPSKTFKLAI